MPNADNLSNNIRKRPNWIIWGLIIRQNLLTSVRHFIKCPAYPLYRTIWSLYTRDSPFIQRPSFHFPVENQPHRRLWKTIKSISNGISVNLLDCARFDMTYETHIYLLLEKTLILNYITVLLNHFLKTPINLFHYGVSNTAPLAGVGASVCGPIHFSIRCPTLI